MSKPDTLFVLAASYDTVADAEADYQAVKALYHDVHTSHDFDAAVITRNEDGRLKVVKKREEPTRHGAAKGLVWGLAIGAVTAVLPAAALVDALVVGGGAGSAVGAVRGHMKRGMKNDDLKELAEVLERGEAGLVVVYAANMADQIAASIKAVNRAISEEIDANADELARAVKEAEDQNGGSAD
jgi:uncharacterized membrane protein